MSMEVPDDALRVDVHHEGASARLVVRGEIDIATAPRFAAAFERALEGAPERIVIDCSGLTFLDSSGIQVLVAAWDQMKDRAGMPVVLREVSPVIQQVLVACGIRDLLME